MSVKVEANGRRSIQVEVEVPGTPEEVWRAIATGPGISSWFVPTKSDERVGGVSVLSFGPGMDSVAQITEWDPPRRFAATSDGMGPGALPMATEWIVEARGGGKCVVRVVHSLFASVDDWDNQLTGTESGWPGFFRILLLYMTHYRGQPCTLIQLMRPAPGTQPEAWATLAGALGLAGAKDGQRWQTPAGPPTMAGTVERISDAGTHRDALLRLEQPTSGLAMIGAFDCGCIMVSLSFYLYGDQASAVGHREEPAWLQWLSDLFPTPK